MPRRLVKKLANLIRARRHKWYLNIFGDRLTDSHLWTLNRHSITAAFGIGILDYRQLELALDFLSQSSRRRLIAGNVKCFIFDPPYTTSAQSEGLTWSTRKGRSQGAGREGTAGLSGLIELPCAVPAG